MPNEKDFEAILKNVIDGYLPEALEKNLPALRSNESSREIEVTLIYGFLALVIMLPDRKDAIKGVKMLAEKCEREWNFKSSGLDILLSSLSEYSSD